MITDDIECYVTDCDNWNSRLFCVLESPIFLQRFIFATLILWDNRKTYRPAGDWSTKKRTMPIFAFCTSIISGFLNSPTFMKYVKNTIVTTIASGFSSKDLSDAEKVSNVLPHPTPQNNCACCPRRPRELTRQPARRSHLPLLLQAPLKRATLTSSLLLVTPLRLVVSARPTVGV